LEMEFTAGCFKRSLSDVNSIRSPLRYPQMES
jgi:hypothetical protein